MTPFTLSAKPGTDVWKKHPSWDVYNVPTKATPVKPLKSFRSASVTFTGQWTEQYDQAGFLLTLTPHDSANKTPRKWIKAGLEFYQGIPQLSTVACDRYADWSIQPLAAVGPTEGPITITIEHDASEHGESIWVYYEPGNGKEKVPMREIGWFYAEEGGEWDLEVAALAARPAEGTSDSLTVEFSDFDVAWV